MKIYSLSLSCLLASLSISKISCLGEQEDVNVDKMKSKNKSNSAEEARWLVNVSRWGVLSFPDPKDAKRPLTNIGSFADVKGRIFLYLMGPHTTDGDKGGGITLTMSEAALEPTSNFAGAACGADGDKDPEDPRCAKLSIEGNIAPCETEEVCAAGKEALFERHPQMRDWPKGHNFIVHELKPRDVWMIANYGGGGTIGLDAYQTATPKRHASLALTQITPHGHGPPPHPVDVEASHPLTFAQINEKDIFAKVPDWKNKAERARWVVAHSLWTTVSTISVRLHGSGWGNIRSTVDGTSYETSTGKPVFYLPKPDPTHVDVQTNPTVSLTFSEAALAERLDDNGASCGARDAMDPLCARVVITGKAVEVPDPKTALEAFKKKHTLAPWLAKGGAHTGGNYYTIEPEQVTILDFYGGATSIAVSEYLAWKAPSSSLENIYLRGSI